MRAKHITRLVSLAPEDYLSVRKLAEAKGLGHKDISGTLRTIIREWILLRRAFFHSPSPEQIEETAGAAAKIVVDRGEVEPSDPPGLQRPAVDRDDPRARSR
jgi:hypothetical protein